MGIWVLSTKKGTRFHKRLGYTYAVSMLMVNATAFGIYRLMHTFGPFHVAALISLATLIAGLVPAMRKNRKPDWMLHHLSYMYWSVIGLYAAFFSEMAVRLRIPAAFGMLVFAATGITVLVGFVGHRYLMKKWSRT